MIERARLLTEADARPFSVPQLADRWGCSEGLVRKLIRDEQLQCFRPGALIRISAAEVERYECQKHHQSSPTRSRGSPGDSSSCGGRTAARGRNVVVSSSPHKIGPAPKPKLASAGTPAEIVRGPWDGA